MTQSTQRYSLGQVMLYSEAYVVAARRVHVMTVSLRPLSGHHPGRHQARTYTSDRTLHLKKPRSTRAATRHGVGVRRSSALPRPPLRRYSFGLRLAIAQAAPTRHTHILYIASVWPYRLNILNSLFFDALAPKLNLKIWLFFDILFCLLCNTVPTRFNLIVPSILCGSRYSRSNVSNQRYFACNIQITDTQAHQLPLSTDFWTQNLSYTLRKFSYGLVKLFNPPNFLTFHGNFLTRQHGPT